MRISVFISSIIIKNVVIVIVAFYVITMIFTVTY